MLLPCSPDSKADRTLFFFPLVAGLTVQGLLAMHPAGVLPCKGLGWQPRQPLSAARAWYLTLQGMHQLPRDPPALLLLLLPAAV